LLALLFLELEKDPISISDFETVFSIDLMLLFLNYFSDERSVLLILLIWDWKSLLIELGSESWSLELAPA